MRDGFASYIAQVCTRSRQLTMIFHATRSLGVAATARDTRSGRGYAARSCVRTGGGFIFAIRNSLTRSWHSARCSVESEM